MKLFFLTPQLPYPPHQGTTIRNFNIIKHLAPLHEITLLSFGTANELQNAEPLRAFCRIEIAPSPTRSLMQRALTTFFSPLPDMALRLQSNAMHETFAAMLRAETFDVMQIEGIEMAEVWRLEVINWDGLPTPNFQLPAVVFDDHNAEYILQRTAFESDARRVTRWHAALYSLIQWKKLAHYERTVCRRANRVIAASETDARALRDLDSSMNVSVIPNGVDTDHFVPSDKVCTKPLAEFAMVFTGKMDFRPNVDAMLWFCDEILPRIRAEIPLAHMVIVGQRPTPRIRALCHRTGIEVTGWVSDTRPYVADAAVCVVPLRMGSGTRLKVLEAMAMGKAIVSTTRGVEGIDLTPGREALIADTPEAFTRAVVALLHDADRRRVLGRAARALAESKFDWRKIVPAFEHVYGDLLR
jgi:sugar transferase (PEP-CTERM/EpsH1 system associated)